MCKFFIYSGYKLYESWGILTAITIINNIIIIIVIIIICLDRSLFNVWPGEDIVSLFSSFIWAPLLVLGKFCPLLDFLNFQSLLLSILCFPNGRILESIYFRFQFYYIIDSWPLLWDHFNFLFTTVLQINGESWWRICGIWFELFATGSVNWHSFDIWRLGTVVCTFFLSLM